jgi:hypothetical protein
VAKGGPKPAASPPDEAEATAPANDNSQKS